MPVPWYLRSYQERQNIIRTVRFYIFFFLSLFCLYQTFVSFVLCPYRTESEGMFPRINRGDYLLVQPMHHWFYQHNKRLPKRGDIVLINVIPKNNNQHLHWFTILFDPFIKFFTLQHISLVTYKEQNIRLSHLVLKRVIGLPGDWVKIENSVVYVKEKDSLHFVTEFEASSSIYEIQKITHKSNGENITDNKIWKMSTSFSKNFSKFQLSENEIFVLGDNRAHINDSRITGSVPLSSIQGQVKTIYWPLKRIKRQIKR